LDQSKTNSEAERILERITDAYYALDLSWRFTYVNGQAERLLNRRREDLLGKNVWDEFPEAVGSVFQENFQRAIAENTVVSLEEYYQPFKTWLEVRAYPAPEGLSVYFHDIGERKMLETEQVRLANTNRLLLESSREGIYSIDIGGRFTSANSAAMDMLGYDVDEVLGREAHALIHHTRLDGSPHSRTDSRIHRVLQSGKSYHVEDDVFWRKDSTEFRVGYTASPIVVAGVVEGVVVNFSDITERVALEETREALFTRDRNIAEQLQVALQPDVPDRVPGMAVAKYYEAALTNEANVGGDFYDVFSIKKGVTALVVGDLSGKGLLAAAQVATVRNMLRAFLLTRPVISSALNALNNVLAKHAMLKGFATLFVGVYNESTRTLTYVNCGQEPALIRRFNTQEIEELQSTGPVMGAFPNARYREKTVSMNRLDALAVFTDGFTEVGPSHSNMLEIDGVIALLKQDFHFDAAISPTSAVRIIRRTLIQGVNEAARGGDIRDDMCLLVAVAE